MNDAKYLLLVEDEVIIAMREKVELERRGYRVALARDGSEAVERAAADAPFDLILMDIDLGSGMDGTEAAQLILESKTVPILFLSSHTEDAIVAKTERITNYGYVVKGSGITVLDASIKMALKLHSAYARAENELAERKKIETELRKAETRARAMLDAIPDLIFRIDAKGTFLDYKADKADLYVQGPADILGRNFHDLMPETFSKILDGQIAAALETKGLRTFDYELEMPGAGKRQYEARMVASGRDELTTVVRDVTREREREGLLRESEYRFREAFDKAPIGISLTEFDGGMPYVNRVFAEMLGYSIAEINEKKFVDLTHPDDIEKSMEATRLLRGGQAETLELRKRYLRKDGDTVWVDLSMAVMRDALGTPKNFIAHVRDISAQTRAEEALRASQERYRALVELMPVGVIAVTEDGMVEFANSASARLFARDEARDLVGEPWMDLVPPPDREKASRILLAGPSSADTPIEYLEIELRRTDGSPYLAEVGGKLIEFEGKSDLLVLIRDITERIEAERAQKEISALYSDIFHKSRAVMLLINPSSLEIIDANEAAEDFYGYEGGRMRELKISDLNELPEAQVREAVSEIAGGRKPHARFRHRTSDGSVRHVEVFPSPIEYSGMIVNHAIIFDITERVAAEERNKRLMNENSLILREVQHRMKNSMSLIASFIDLRRRSSANAEARDVLSEVMTQVHGMGVLYDKLYRLAQGEGHLMIETFLPELLEASVALLGRKDEIRLDLSIAGLSLPVKRISHIGIILNELLTNSVKYAFADVAEPLIRVTGTVAGKSFRLVYEDNGKGLPMGFSFESDSGFGMLLVRSLVDQLGGKIAMEARRGACFAIELPI